MNILIITSAVSLRSSLWEKTTPVRQSMSLSYNYNQSLVAIQYNPKSPSPHPNRQSSVGTHRKSTSYLSLLLSKTSPKTKYPNTWNHLRKIIIQKAVWNRWDKTRTRSTVSKWIKKGRTMSISYLWKWFINSS